MEKNKLEAENDNFAGMRFCESESYLRCIG